MEITLGVLLIFVLITSAFLIALQIRKPAPPIDNQSLVLLQGQLNSLQGRLDEFGKTVSDTLQDSSKLTNTWLDNAAKVVGDLREKVGEIHEVGKAAAELLNIMRAPKL